MRIEQCFSQLKKVRRKALIPYIMAGDPSLDATLKIMDTLQNAGADIIELGVPFSDPIADGAVIQAAGERSLSNQTNLRGILDTVSRFKSTGNRPPVVLMTYLNPIEQIGMTAFAKAACDAGVDGVLIVDLPPEEADAIKVILEEHEITLIFLLALTTNHDRMQQIISLAKGFLYCISLKGVTGSDCLDIAEISKNIMRIQDMTKLPIGVGFGIHDAKAAAELAKVCDAIIVGSAVVRIIAEHADNLTQCKDKLSSFIKCLRIGIDTISNK